MGTSEITTIAVLLVICAVAVVIAVRVKSANAVANCGSAVPFKDSLGFENRTGKPVKGVYLNISGSWSPDNLVQGAPLQPGERRELPMKRGYLSPANDVKVVCTDDSEFVCQRLPVRIIMDLTVDEKGEPHYEVVSVGS